jgi:hypothetical protein
MVLLRVFFLCFQKVLPVAVEIDEEMSAKKDCRPLVHPEVASRIRIWNKMVQKRGGRIVTSWGFGIGDINSKLSML